MARQVSYFGSFFLIREWLVDSGANRQSIMGCDRSELARVEKAFGGNISAEHLAFLEVFGKQSPLTSDADMATYPSVLDLPTLLYDTAIANDGDANVLKSWVPISNYGNHFMVYTKRSRMVCCYSAVDGTYDDVAEGIVEMYFGDTLKYAGRTKGQEQEWYVNAGTLTRADGRR